MSDTLTRLHLSSSLAWRARRPLALVLGLLAFSSSPQSSQQAWAIGPLTQFHVVRLDLGGSTPNRDSGLLVLAEQLRLQTSIEVSLEVKTIKLGDKRLFEFPFLVVAANKPIRRLSRAHSNRLKMWLEAGGTLFVDNTNASESFDRSLREELARILPRAPLSRIPSEHVLYRSFYRIDYPAGRVIERPTLEGITLEGRLTVIYSQNDMVGAWCRDPYGNWAFDVMPGGERQRQTSLHMGVNLVEYALCQDYKDDQVHLDYLLHKRNWKIDPPSPTAGTR